MNKPFGLEIVHYNQDKNEKKKLFVINTIVNEKNTLTFFKGVLLQKSVTPI